LALDLLSMRFQTVTLRTRCAAPEELDMRSFQDILKEFYTNEVLGETIYSALFEAATDEREKRKWATLLQLETETKAWLRPVLVANGVGVEEHAADRQMAVGMAGRLFPLGWSEKMQALKDLGGQLLPTYQGYADAAAARGEADAEAVCRYMVEHERAQAEFATRELAGDGAASLAPIRGFLKYPI
jgi:hypothetical protein